MNANEIINERNAKTAENQQTFCRNCVFKAIRQGRKLKNGDNLEDAMQNTFAAVLERLADLESLEATCKKMESMGRTETLASLIMRCAKAALQQQINQAKRDSVIVDSTTTTADGQQFDFLDTVAAKDSTENAAIIQAELKRFVDSLDNTNKVIFGGMIKGETEREIAPTVGISNVAVHKRMVKIRTALAAIIF